MLPAPATPTKIYAYISSSDVATYIGTTGPLLSDNQQRALIGQAYSLGVTHLNLYSFDGTISSNTFSTAAKAHLLRFVQLCAEWNIRVAVAMGNITNNRLNAIIDYNNNVANQASETIDYILEDEFWNNGYGDFFRVRGVQTANHAALLASGCRSITYLGFTKQNGDSYNEDFTITAITAGVATMTFTTSVNHNFVVGGTCRLSGVSGYASNPSGDFVMTAAAGNQFTITHSAGAGSYSGGATVSSVYAGTTEIQEIQSIFDEHGIHAYNLIPYYSYTDGRLAEFTVPVDVHFIISGESTTQAPVQSNNFSGNFLMGRTPAGALAYAPKSLTQAYQYLVVDTSPSGLNYTPLQQGATPPYANADTTPSIVNNITIVGISLFTLTMMRNRLMANGPTIMVYGGDNQSSSLLSWVITLNTAYAFDDWIGAPLTYSWTVVSGPPGYTVANFSSTTALNPTFTYAAPGLGNWLLRLTVTDGTRVVSSDVNLFITGVAGSMTLSVVEGKTPTCNGDCDGEAIATVGGVSVAPYTYVWSVGPPVGPTGSITDTRTGLCSGVVSCTVTDSTPGTPQTATASATVATPPPLVVTLDVDNPNCPGGSDGEITMVVTGGLLGIAAIQWTRNGVIFVPADDYLITGVNAAVYEVTVTDNNGCIKIASVTVTEPIAMTEVDVIVDPTCFGGSDGTITVVVSGGTGTNYTYAWYNISGLILGENKSTITGRPAGDYTLVVTDENGCTQSFNFTLTDPSPIVVTPFNAVPNLCIGVQSTFSAVVTGGVGPYIYDWSPLTDIIVNPSDNSIAAFLPTTPGPYSYGVTVTDSQGCVGFASFSGIVYPEFTTLPDITVSGILGTCVGATVTLRIENFSDFSAVLWSTGETTQEITVGTPDVYYVTGVSPLAGSCTTQSQIVIASQGTTLQLIEQINNVCGGGNASGEIEVDTVGGCAPYTWEWRNENNDVIATTESVTGLANGTYTLIATDDLGQTAVETYVISTSSPTVAISFTNISGTTGGTATAVVTGGTTPYLFLWTDPNGTTYTGQTITGLFVQGMYTLLCTDGNGCTAFDIVCISNQYSFGMSECEFKCFLQEMSCCQADMAYKLIEKQRGGEDCCVEKFELMEVYLQLLECYYPEGAVIKAGKYAAFMFTLNSYSNGGVLQIDFMGTQILNYTFNTARTYLQNIDSIVTALTAAGNTTTYLTDGISFTQFIINAPAIGSGYNGVPMTLTTANVNAAVLTTQGMAGGQDTLIADPPCLSDEQVRNIIESMREIADCKCSNLTQMVDDTLIN